MADFMDEKAEAYFRAALEEIADELLDEWDCAFTLCQSPIEQMMLSRLVFMKIGYGDRRWNEIDHLGLDDNPFGPPRATDDPTLVIHPQAKVGKYHADFCCVLSCHGAMTRIVVECDGHDYHERSKEQAQHDKARDRFFTSNGYAVFRFTGSEIYRNDINLLAELELYCARWVEKVVNFVRLRDE